MFVRTEYLRVSVNKNVVGGRELACNKSKCGITYNFILNKSLELQPRVIQDQSESQ
jgi:hypothetical protein